jgi:sodium borate transporter 11
VIQLLVIVFIGFAPWSYLQMMFPLALAVLIPVRHLIIPYFIDPKFLPALESFE